MNLKLKSQIEEALNKVFDEVVMEDEDWWSGYIHPGLIRQLTDSVEVTFDAAMDTSEFIENEVTST